MIETEGFHAAGVGKGDLRKSIEAQMPLGRILRPHDIVSGVVFFASDDASWILGPSLYVTGVLR